MRVIIFVREPGKPQEWIDDTVPEEDGTLKWQMKFGVSKDITAESQKIIQQKSSEYAKILLPVLQTQWFA
jgi:hypothetical protein